MNSRRTRSRQEKLSRVDSLPPSESVKENEEEARPEMAPGRCLELAFEGGRRIFNEKTEEEMKLQELVWDYLAPNFHSKYYVYLEEEGRGHAGSTGHELQEIFGEMPIDSVVLKLRQDFLKDIVGQETGDKAEKADKLDDARGDTDSLLSDMSRGLLSITEGRGPAELEKDLDWDLYYLDFFINKKGVFKTLGNLEEHLSTLSADSLFMKELKGDLTKIRSEFEKYGERLNNSGMKGKLENLREAFEKFLEVGGDSEGRPINGEKVTGYKNIDELNRALRELSDKGEAIDGFINKLASLSKFLILAVMIVEKGLKPVEIVDENVVEFKNMRNPFLCKSYQYDEKKVIGSDISLTPDKPNIIFTGKNACGKSKVVEAVLLNIIPIQSTGFGFVDGGRFSPRLKLGFLRSIPEEVGESQFSRGQKEMMAVSRRVEDSSDRSLEVFDEVLTSTDSLGAISLILAMLEKNAQKGGMGLLTVHSRDLEIIREKNLAPSVVFMKSKEGPSGKKTYQWEEGIGRSDPIELAKEAGLPGDIIKLAQIIKRQIEDGEK